MEINKTAETVVYQKPRLLLDNVMHYCPGCSHGVVHKIIAEALDEMDLEERAIGISPVGCSVLAYDYIDIDWIQSAHGRAPAKATAAKRLNPDLLVFTYQGDGDLAAIGTSEAIHACARGESIVIIYVNNAIYGMTGGQMAPTTLLGQRTATTPMGRDAAIHGFPYKMGNLVAEFEGVRLVTRQSVEKPAAVRMAKRAIKKAFQNSLDNRGASFVEIVATCNSGWKMSPVKANEWMQENMFASYPLGDIKNE
ncbi:MAG: thiamine pyrophosphate-dependent enzyme [Rikenellaceae bacterium]